MTMIHSDKQKSSSFNVDQAENMLLIICIILLCKWLTCGKRGWLYNDIHKPKNGPAYCAPVTAAHGGARLLLVQLLLSLLLLLLRY